MAVLWCYDVFSRATPSCCYCNVMWMVSKIWNSWSCGLLMCVFALFWLFSLCSCTCIEDRSHTILKTALQDLFFHFLLFVVTCDLIVCPVQANVSASILTSAIHVKHSHVGFVEDTHVCQQPLRFFLCLAKEHKLFLLYCKL